MKDIAQSYLFELLERNIRFSIHLDKIKSQFYFREGSEDKLNFIDEYKLCLNKQFEMIYAISKVFLSEGYTDYPDLLLLQIRSGIGLLGKLHTEGLHYLPRPSEPVELDRFSRIIDKHYLKWPESLKGKAKGISFFPTEDISETIFKKSALDAFKGEINAFVREHNEIIKRVGGQCTSLQLQELEGEGENQNAFHMTIPRIDSANPARWPTLLHEISHHIMSDEFFEDDILSDFKSKYTAVGCGYLEKVFANDDDKLHNWLLECWCDLFASFVIGPAFFFSQYSAFIFADSLYDVNNVCSKEHPPAAFRLKLIFSIMQHRGKLASEPDVYHLMSNSLQLYRKVSSLQEVFPTGITPRDIDAVLQLFKDFFLGTFFRNDLPVGTGNELKEALKQYFQSYESIDMAVIKSMLNRIERGFPVPSTKIEESDVAERPTTVQEILLAAWMYRQNSLQNEVFDVLGNSAIDDKYSIILETFNRYDQSVLRSIQVSEWFQLFYKDPTAQLSKPMSQPAQDFLAPGMLVDAEIYDRLLRGSLVVSPLIDWFKQIGSSSLDVRLGTSFQVFNRTGRGYIDFTDDDSTNTFDQNSINIDLDFLESITIHPGQFVLAHTMEYIGLPENLAAEIEGRSSFARMGLEVHMTAGFIDPGFEGVITLEIFNAGAMPIILYPGMRIAQLRFLPVNKPERSYNRKSDAKYKGFLMHNYTLQNKDPEVTCIKEAKAKTKCVISPTI